MGGALLLYLEHLTGICEIQIIGLPFGHETTEGATDIFPPQILFLSAERGGKEVSSKLLLLVIQTTQSWIGFAPAN